MKQLHILLFPMLAHGHMIPMVDMAKMFISRGLRATIITTQTFADPVLRAQRSGHGIGLNIIKFPPEGSSLPENIVRLDQVTGDTHFLFFEALAMLQRPLELLLQELPPDCLVSDTFLHWTLDSAAKFGIPRLVFHGTSCLALTVTAHMHLYEPFKGVSSDSESFVVPHLPHRFTFFRTQVAPFFQVGDNPFSNLLKQMRDSDQRSYGVVFNSFYELESVYADHYSKVLGRKAWHIGPFLRSNRNADKAKAIRGNTYAIDEQECLEWLDSKASNSVAYICFGSMPSFSPAQLHEMAKGFEDSHQNFIWVLRKSQIKEQQIEEWMPEGFENQIKDKGLIIRGWAPQVMILNHSSIGAFVTHCGWNSTLEGICAGVPMVTWPLFAEQFYNEKLLVDILKIGVSVGSKNWLTVANEGVPREAVTAALLSVLVGTNAVEMKSRAMDYQKQARMAVEEGGSSWNTSTEFIQEFTTI